MLGFGQVPMEVVIRASNQLAPGLASAGAQLRAFQTETAAASGQMSLPGIGGGGGGVGLLGRIGPTLAIAAGVTAIAGLIAAGKSLVETDRARRTALADLKQAADQANIPFDKYQKQVEDFLSKHGRYISDLNAVREGYASLTRAGIDQKLVQTAINDALDLSILRHEDFGTTLQKILLGMEGNARGLKTLGINVKDYGDLTRSHTQILADNAAAHKKVEEASVNLAKAQRTLKEEYVRLHDKGYTTNNDLMHEQDLKAKVRDATQKLKDAQGNYNTVVGKGNDQAKNQADLLATIHQKSKDGRPTLDDLSQAQNRLNQNWEHFARDTAPLLRGALTGVIDDLATMVAGLDNIARGVGSIFSATNKTGQGVGPGHWVTGPSGFRGGPGPRIWVADVVGHGPTGGSGHHTNY